MNRSKEILKMFENLFPKKTRRYFKENYSGTLNDDDWRLGEDLTDIVFDMLNSYGFSNVRTKYPEFKKTAISYALDLVDQGKCTMTPKQIMNFDWKPEFNAILDSIENDPELFAQYDF